MRFSVNDDSLSRYHNSSINTSLTKPFDEVSKESLVKAVTHRNVGDVIFPKDKRV